MANTLTNLYPDIYEGLNRVSRELTGFIVAASRDSGIDGIILCEISNKRIIRTKAPTE